MKRFWIIPGSLLALGAIAWLAFFRGDGGEGDIEYRYEKVQRGELVRSISATGKIVALTAVDVKSKAGGIVVRLAVDEGSEVKKGDLIAVIDPRDTQALYEQALADVRQAEARAAQAERNYELQKSTTVKNLEEAQASLETAKIRLAKAEIEASRQPQMSAANLQSAQAAYDSAREELSRFESVTAPQMLRDVQSGETRAKAEFDAARADYERQRDLFEKGYVSQAAVDRAKATFEAAQAAYDVVKQRASTIERDIAAQRKSLNLSVERASAALDEARASLTQVEISKRNLEEARRAVRLAEIALEKAKDAKYTEEIRRSEVAAAKAGTVRSSVALDNAKVQLDSTTVVAPRDGVVTMKYLEEGTIIPPGTSLFAQGTSIVQISDISTLYLECNVDEADIADVRVRQPVRIVTEAFPGVMLNGKVVRVNPAAVAEQNITAIKVRVEILPGYKVRILPGMTASAEFLTLTKKDVLIVPGRAIRREEGKTFVRVKGKDPLKPEMREVKVGETGNNGVEVLEGLREGEEVVTAEIDLAELRRTQERMIETMQGGGLASGGPGMGRRPTTSAASRAAAGGGGGMGAGQRGDRGGSGAGR